MEFIAHRGMPRAVRENTLRAFELALDAGADGIELDVHVSADAMVVVHHDPVLPGAQAAAIAQSTVADLAPYGIPTLDAVCDLVGDRAALYVEAKAPHSAAQIIECLTAHQVRAAVHSFDQHVVEAVRRMAPGIPVGLLLSTAVGDPGAVARAHAVRDLWPDYKMIDAAFVDAVHAVGARVIAWTVNESNDARRLQEMGVDAMCTDDVRALRSALHG